MWRGPVLSGGQSCLANPPSEFNAEPVIAARNEIAIRNRRRRRVVIDWWVPVGSETSERNATELFRMAHRALDIVIVARETASMSSPSLNGSRTSLPLN